ncbi:four helix bundle protein [bacterium]|nr:four helix bundle protein [bacterium]
MVKKYSTGQEGYGRFYYKEGIQFYRISRASVYELKDHLISCFDLKFIDKNIYDDGLIIIEDAKKLINGYINFVKKQQVIDKKMKHS